MSVRLFFISVGVSAFAFFHAERAEASRKADIIRRLHEQDRLEELESSDPTSSRRKLLAGYLLAAKHSNTASIIPPHYQLQTCRRDFAECKPVFIEQFMFKPNRVETIWF